MACELRRTSCWSPLSGNERPGLGMEVKGPRADSSLKAAKKQGCVWNIVVKNRNQFWRERVCKDSHSLIGSRWPNSGRFQRSSGIRMAPFRDRPWPGRELLGSWAAEGFTQDWRGSSSWHVWWPPQSPHCLLTMPQKARKMPASSDCHCSFY